MGAARCCRLISLRLSLAMGRFDVGVTHERKSGLQAPRLILCSVGEAELSGRNKPVGAILALDEPSAREWQMSGDKPPFLAGETIEKARTRCYSHVRLVVDRYAPGRILE